MPYDIRIISSNDFLRLDAEGHMDLDASRRLLCDAVWATTQTGIGRVLIDVREATSDMTAAQVASLAVACHELSLSGTEHRVALLNRPKDDFDRAAYLASLTGDHGWKVEAFRSFEEAFNWLNG